MKLLYTDISYDLTRLLTEEARACVANGCRVFYIAPNSLSFEKERQVLSLLPEKASFQLMVTRFSQLGRYFITEQKRNQESLDDTGLAMLVYRLLMEYAETDLKAYAHLRQDQHFVAQIVDLYHELKRSHLTYEDLVGLTASEKEADLQLILARLETHLDQGNYEMQTKLASFTDEVLSGRLDQELSQTVFVIDGFTRFSAEEESLIAALNEKCSEIIIGTYASQKAYQSNFITGNVYQASVTFLQELASRFQVRPDYLEVGQKHALVFEKVSQLFEANHDFSELHLDLSEQEKEQLHIWEVINQKEEVEHVAKAIRQKLYQGYRYKDILVLLGDVDAYKLQIGKIFDKYEIPYYFGKAESMSAHPLVHLMDSLERVKRYHFRPEDVMNLFKSGLYGRLSMDQLDKFEQYVIYADLKGQSQFYRDFTLDNQGKFDLEILNHWREELVTPLQNLFKSQKQLGKNLLQKLLTFFQAVDLPTNFAGLNPDGDGIVQEKQEQVWKVFTGILEQFETIFGQKKMTLAECLSLIRQGMLAAEYRTVPATYDVVMVKSYDLVEPHSNRFVFALGMTQSHFPKLTQNHSLISDEERLAINAGLTASSHQGRFDVASKENLKKNHFSALSVFNAATCELVLSFPQLANESQDKRSAYLQELHDFGIPIDFKDRQSLAQNPEDIGNYKALLSRVIEVNRLAVTTGLSSDEQTFWSVAVRYLRKKMESHQLKLPQVLNPMQTKTLADEVLQAKFRKEHVLSLSASALTTFYNNQYKYFLQYVLGLQEMETIKPDARHYGTYLHRIFERLMQDNTSQDFDSKLIQAIQATNQEPAFQVFYGETAETRYSLTVLEDIARSTASALRPMVSRVQEEEKNFCFQPDASFEVKGIIDRVDRLPDGSLGIVDYKSSKQQFDIQRFYNGLSPQLVTYIQALQQNQESLPVFGAMYLHMQEPKVALSAVKSLDKISEEAQKTLTYRGLFLETEKAHLADGHYHLRDSLYSPEDLALLLAYNEELYAQAARKIREGHFLINPYSEDGKSVQGDQLKAITQFEADEHLPYARHLTKLPAKARRQGFLDLMKGGD